MENEPLKELFEIARIDFALSEKISNGFPVEMLNYDALCTRYLSSSPRLKILAEMLMDRIPKTGLDLNVLFIQFKDSSNHDLRKIVARLIATHFSDNLGLPMLYSLCEISASNMELLMPVMMSKYGGELNCEQLFYLRDANLESEWNDQIVTAIMNLPKENLDIGLLKEHVSDNCQFYLNAASSLLLNKFEDELDIATLIHMIALGDENIRSLAQSVIDKMPKEKINVQIVIKLQESSDADVRESAFRIAELIPVEWLEQHFLIRCLAHSDKDVNKLAYTLLSKLPSKRLPYDQLRFLANQGSNKQRECASLLLLSKFKDRLDYDTLIVIFNSSSLNEIYEEAAIIILQKYSEVVEDGTLNQMKNIKNGQIAELYSQITKKREEQLEVKAKRFFSRYNFIN